MTREVAWFQHRDVAVPGICDGWPADRFLVERFREWPADELLAGLDAGLVTDGRAGPVLQRSSAVRAGQVLDVRIPGLAPTEPPPPFPRILHEDARVIAVDKPSDLLMHPGGTRFQYALVSLAKQRWPDHPVDLAHRLDRDTSGVVVLTKDKNANAALKASFREGRATKRYVARVLGRPAWDTAEITDPIGRADGPIRIQMGVRRSGQSATTVVRVLARDRTRPEALVALSPVTGRTHQLRVHLARVGHPILGDVLYGTDDTTFLDICGKGRSPDTDRRTRAPRLLLHARALTLPHPDGGALHVEAPLPMALVDRRGW